MVIWLWTSLPLSSSRYYLPSYSHHVVEVGKLGIAFVTLK